MWTEPKLVERPEQPYVAIKVLVTMQELSKVIPPLNAEVFDWLAKHEGAPSGPPFWKYNVIDMERQLEVEAGVTVQQPMQGDDRVLAGVLPSGMYATLLHTGHPKHMIDATAALLDWGDKQGLTWDRADGPEGDCWTCRLDLHLTDPAEQPDMDKWETELAFKLADR